MATPTCVPFGISNHMWDVLPAALPGWAMSGSRWTGKPELLSLQNKDGHLHLAGVQFSIFVVSRKFGKGKYYGSHTKKGRTENSVVTDCLLDLF